MADLSHEQQRVVEGLRHQVTSTRKREVFSIHKDTLAAYLDIIDTLQKEGIEGA